MQCWIDRRLSRLGAAPLYGFGGDYVETLFGLLYPESAILSTVVVFPGSMLYWGAE